MNRAGVVTDWSPDKVQAFGREVTAFRHNLHERPLFSDEALASILDRFPRDKLGVFTMGEDLAEWTSWRRGSPGGLNGDQLLRAVQSGRLWLNLRNANRHLSEFAALCDEIAADKERHVPGLKTRNRDLGLLISSPRALVFYHLDVPLSSLWQIRGQKQIWFYPRAEPFVTDVQIERFVRREEEGQFAFEPTWDKSAEQLTLDPGAMVTWAQNAPHRVENGPMTNVSLSMEFMTPQALRRTNVIYANGLLRQRLGLNPKVQETLGPISAAKLLLAGAAKAAGRGRATYAPVLPDTFTVEAPTPAEAVSRRRPPQPRTAAA